MSVQKETVTVVIIQRKMPPRVFKGERFEDRTPDDILGMLVPRVGVLPWRDPCAVNGREVPLDSDYQLEPGDKLQVWVD